MVHNVVLVHGAYADGSSWTAVTERLQRRGLNVAAVQNPLTSLADDVAHTRRVLALQDGPTILAGHSFAGTVITEAGTDTHVVGLVYVAARAPTPTKTTAPSRNDSPPRPRAGASFTPMGLEVSQSRRFCTISRTALNRSRRESSTRRKAGYRRPCSTTGPRWRRGDQSQPGTRSRAWTARSHRSFNASWPTALAPRPWRSRRVTFR